jgi:alpha-L-fucosidase 2
MAEYRAFASGFYGLSARDDRYADPRHEPALIPGVMTIKGQAMGGWGQYSLSPTHSAWIAQSFYLHWKHTGDEAFLRERAYPFCAAVGNGLLGLMTKDEKGYLKLPLSTSPEIHDNSYAAWLIPNSNYDLSLMRWLFAALKEMAEVGGEPDVAARWSDALASMEPLHVDEKTGLMFDARETYAESHRHFSHAMAIHPLGILSIEGTDADRAAIDATLDQMKAMGTDWWTGYSFSWAACMFARAGRAEEALEFLTKYLAFTGPNGFHLNGDQTKSGLSKFTYRPFTLEGNFLAMEAIHQMLMQSHGTVGVPGSEAVRIFPAVSEKWADVSFDGLRAEGGWVVSGAAEVGRDQPRRDRATGGFA